MTTKNYIKGQRNVKARPRSKRLRELGLSTTIVNSGGAESSESSTDYATESNHSRYSDLATEAQNLTPDSTDWATIDAKDSATLAAAIADAMTKYLSKLNPDTAQGLIRFLAGLKVGSGDYGIDGNGDINARNALFETLSAQEAHFFNLIIDEVKSVGGQLVITPANCTIDAVEAVDGGWKCYFRASDGERDIVNEWAVGDQALHNEFNVESGDTRNYWRLVTAVSSEPVTKVVGELELDCHWVVLSSSDCKTGSAAPMAGDSLSQLGNRTDATRQRAIVVSAYNIPFIDTAPYMGQVGGIQAPLFASYKDIDSYTIGEVNRVNVIAANGNLFNGRLDVASTLSDGRPVNELGTVEGNMLRNTYFGGDYESEPSDATVMMTADTPLWSDPLKHWEVTGEVSVTDYADAKSGRCAVLMGGRLWQAVELEDGAWYMLSLHASGGSLTVAMGENVRTVAIDAGRTRYDIAFQGDGDDVQFSGTCILSDIILTRGTLPVEWERSPLDPDKAKADDMANDYLRKAISEASTSILGGLVLSQIIKVGNYRLNEAGTRYEMSEETGGMSGAMNHERSPFLWCGGDMQKAIHTIDYYKRDPAYEPTAEEVEQMVKFVVTHGGRAILNDVILRGYIYAFGGKFKGAVEALSGIFKNITTPNGSFSIDADGTAKIVNLLVENFGKIASAIFRGDYMLSQYGRAADTDAEDDNYEDFDINNPDGLSAWRPNIYLNFRTGKARFVNADIIGNICMPPLHVTSENFASLFEEVDNRYYLRNWHLSMPAQSLQLEYLPADHDTVLCAQVLTSNYDWTHEGLTVTIVNISGRDYYYEEVMNWSTPTFRYSSIGDKTISQFQLLARPLDPWGYHVLPTLLSSRNI